MDSVLKSLGVNVEYESIAQRNCLREKIKKSIYFSKDNYFSVKNTNNLIVTSEEFASFGPPISNDMPLISNRSLKKLESELRDEIEKSKRNYQEAAMAMLKLRFLDYINFQKKSSHSAESSDEETLMDSYISSSIQEVAVDSSQLRKRTVQHLKTVPHRSQSILGNSGTVIESSLDYKRCKRSRLDESFEHYQSDVAIKETEKPLIYEEEAKVDGLESEMVSTNKDNHLLNEMEGELIMDTQTSSICGSHLYTIGKSKLKPLSININNASTTIEESDHLLNTSSENEDEDSSSRMFTRRSSYQKTPSRISHLKGRPTTKNKISTRKQITKHVQDVSDDEEEEEDTYNDIIKENIAKEEIIDVIDDWEDSRYCQRLLNVMNNDGLRETLTVTCGAVVDTHSWGLLYPYQQDGISWMWSLYKDGTGGILGDEMGLGKTAQLCCHFDNIGRDLVTERGSDMGRFLVVCPTTLMHHWTTEFQHWAPTMRVVTFHRMSSDYRNLEIQKSKILL